MGPSGPVFVAPFSTLDNQQVLDGGVYVVGTEFTQPMIFIMT